MRLLGQVYGYYPLDLKEAYEVDMICDTFQDYLVPIGAVHFKADSGK